MGRTFVGQRKAVPAGPSDDTEPADEQGPPDDSGDDTPDDKDVETCPNCDCQFTDSDDGSKPEIIKPGKKVEGDTSGYKGDANQGADLDAVDSAQPTPGKFGSAHDAALGDQVMAQLLGGAGRMRS